MWPATRNCCFGIRRRALSEELLSAARLLLLVQHAFKEVCGIRAERLGYGDELRHVDLPLVALDHSDDGMRPPQTCGQLSLRHAFPFTCLRKDGCNG